MRCVLPSRPARTGPATGTTGPEEPTASIYAVSRDTDRRAITRQPSAFAVPLGTAGTDSWYWGIDDFGLYSITGTSAEPPKLTLARSGADWILSWTTAEAGFVLESSPSLTSPAWTAVTGVTGSQLTVTATDPTRFYRFRKP